MTDMVKITIERSYGPGMVVALAPEVLDRATTEDTTPVVIRSRGRRRSTTSLPASPGECTAMIGRSVVEAYRRLPPPMTCSAPGCPLAPAPEPVRVKASRTDDLRHLEEPRSVALARLCPKHRAEFEALGWLAPAEDEDAWAAE